MASDKEEQNKTPFDRNLKSTVKRDFLRAIEEKVQAQWEQQKVWEQDAPADTTQPKYMGTFPYPYMNGRLHLGHTFTLTKVEFAMGYQRLKGKKCLFPFGFHCTGMPIKACADKLKREIEQFGNPPKFPERVKVEQEELPTEKQLEKPDPTAFHAKKSKVQAKSAGASLFQWEIMEQNGVPPSEIAKFADAEHWLSHFPPLCKEDLKRFGLSVDWRRSFITTDVNPYYDSFVRWQFETLRDLNKIQFGKRYTVYSPKDGQPCADHDRASGEGVLPQEYTLIKLELIAPFPQKIKFLEGKKRVFLVPATLRPETMYGQTNCWVLPDGEYGAFEISDSEVFICSARAARNLSFQNFSKQFGETNCLAELKGWDILGIPVKAPLAKYPAIYTLPLLTISMTKGTGIVTSVPSDAPDDYVGLEELKRKPEFRKRFGIQDHMILPYQVVPIISIPDLGNTAAVKVSQDLDIKSPKERDKLDQAKDIVYNKGFYDGVLLVGEYKSRFVRDVKTLIRDKMVAAGEAVIYSEPASLVMSRSGDECVVCLTDQWFLDYGEAKWRSQVEKHLKTMELYSDDTRHKFEFALGWLGPWACSRTYGLGTKLPWDPQYLIESLSDSTIYMAYYTVAHLLQGGVFDGSQPGPAGIKPEQMTRQVWDYIFLGSAYPVDCQIPEATLQQLRREFTYWYPLDLRVSGKDLIPNHLTFCLYNHLAIWPQSMAPRSFRANGHIMLNGSKMSKQTGNFLTLSQSIDRFTADGTRLGLADAGDSLDDANFTSEAADAALLRLYTQIKWTEEMLLSQNLRAGPPTTFADRVFANQINKLIQETDRHYERTNFREALKSGFFELQSARDKYLINVGLTHEGINKQLLMRFIEVQAILISPITPHFSQYIWNLLGYNTPIQSAKWPATTDAVDEVLLKQNEYLQETLHYLRLKKEEFTKPRKGKAPSQPPTKATITVTTSFPSWMLKAMDLVRPLFVGSEPPETSAIQKVLTQDAEMKANMKHVIAFIGVTKDKFKEEGKSALNLKVLFNEKELLEQHADIIKKSVELQELIIEAKSPEETKGQPGTPSVRFS